MHEYWKKVHGKAPFNGTAVTGAALGGAALLVQLLSGSFGNILGGGRPPVGEPPWARDMNYERQLTQADAKIGKLESQLYTDQQVNAVRQEIQGATAAQAVFNAESDKMLAPFLDANGMVDVDRLRADVDAGMKAAGGELEITPEIDPKLRLFGVTIKSIKFTKEDFANFFDNTIPSVSPSAIS